MKSEVVVIGGGPAGMAAAIESSKAGAKTLLIEREAQLGGILNQCIHNGFGVHYFGEELTGPEYARRFVKQLEKTDVQVMTSTFVTNIDKEKNAIEIVSPTGADIIEYRSLVLAMGCRERTAGQIRLKGSRPAGIYTAGQAQKMVNLNGILPGKNVVILGSGDIGLIMARRLTYAGAKVITVAEIQNKSGGLRRNITQCLDDYNIPLELSTTVTRVVGKSRIEGVFLAKVDEKLQPIKKTERFVECDALILSVGLIPEIELAGNIAKSPVTHSAVVNEFRQTSKPNIFACGNVLQVHDLVDNVTVESALAGKSAALYAKGKLAKGKTFKITAGEGISYVVPTSGVINKDKMMLMFRTKKRIEKSFIKVANKDGSEILRRYLLAVNAGQMQNFEIDKSLVKGDIKIFVEQEVKK